MLAQRPAWRFLVLAEIANFAVVRRYVGCARSNMLVADVSSRLSQTAPEMRLTVVGRTTLELAFEGEEATELDRTLDLLRSVCEEPFVLDGEVYRLEICFGAAAGPSANLDDVRLAEEAEAALAEARAAHVPVRHDVGALGAREIRSLIDELRVAIAEEQLFLAYQPKIHVRRQEIGSAEALVRWQHPSRGLVLPGDFIGAAEEGGLIDQLTIWTIERAIADQRRLLAGGHDLRIFINISGQLLGDQAFVDAACRLVAEADAKLGFEVTETSVIRDPASAIANLQRFADIGIVIAIDDYGAGLSSLAYLKQLPARELKIDKLFVTQLTSSNRDPLIVRSTIDLAHALEMEVVAEGVETHAALALLTVMGCDMVQGFLISRPISLEALMTFLEEDRHHFVSQDTRATFNALATAWKRG
ncbi:MULTISPECIES: EAL domain-containing protein [unclassified Sphingomonas]|uniref:EAL domain-containing protein n=1 Tax=unclassified Sphingomonas TaxID=196159 RepID=UPI001D116573|nr:MULTISPECIES: EAL domain-containing protein [unclassified Sphingomonas]MCC2980179.1 EAL domain-containing protein [Sphingomonas sp. IC4-52]MCD2314930.1 EAL domain-containing protein [Sphingomonas sp. IC-11]